MDHLKWDISIYEAYMAAMKKMSKCLEERMSSLSKARALILNQSVASGDSALNRITDLLDGSMKEMTEMDERITRLREALSEVIESFIAAERRNRNMGTDLLYQGLMNSMSAGRVQPYYVAYSSNVQSGQIIPDWLSRLAKEPGGA